MNRADLDPDLDLLLADGFDEAFIGVGHRCGQPPIAVYDRELCIAVLVAQGLDMDEAVEHFDFNVAGAWVGERTPIFLSRIEDKDPLTPAS